MRDVDGAFAALVVHYANPDVYGTIAGLGEQRVHPSRVLVVDNSDSLDLERVPDLPFSVEVTGPVGNAGYAAAVNRARTWLRDGGERYLLVLTHEVMLEPAAAAELVRALDLSPRAAAAGPVLRRRSHREEVFSAGGTLDGALWPSHLPVHLSSDEPLEVDWIDGAVMLLRRDALDRVDWLDEEYFLYFEEIDLAARFRREGDSIMVIPTAGAWQEPGQYPPYLSTRNRLILARAFPELLRIPRAVLVLRMIAEIVWVARRRGWRSIAPSLRGLVAGVRGESGRPSGW